MSQQELIRQAQREYRKQWRSKNPDKVRAAQERYWTKKAHELQREKAEVNTNEK
jgi:polyhydroxyalkanoate synthesis regulator phasin